MAYVLKQPFSEIQRADFIVNYNHRKGLNIAETKDCIYALLPNEEFKEGKIINNEDYKNKLKQNRILKFKENFFETSLGWIMRKVKINGVEKDFFCDLLTLLKLSVEAEFDTKINCYKLPDFDCEINEKYLQSLCEKKSINSQFISECLSKLVSEIT